MSAQSRTPLPVTIISGFLGSGKTTLLNRILAAAPDPKRIAVLENELGSQPVDDELLRANPQGRLDVVAGRTCCESRPQFLQLLYQVAAIADRFDRLIIESTGVAHPGMMAAAILADDALQRAYRVDGIVTVVDAAHLLPHLGEEGHALEQVAYADLLIVNKQDLVSGEQLARVTDRLRDINGLARLVSTAHVEVPVADVLELSGFDLARIEHGVSGCDHADTDASEAHSSKEHCHEIQTVAFRMGGEFDFDRLLAWLKVFLEAHGHKLYRAKGVVTVEGLRQRMVFQGVHGSFQFGGGRAWEEGEQREGRMVFIGRDLDEPTIRAALDGCLLEGIGDGR